MIKKLEKLDFGNGGEGTHVHTIMRIHSVGEDVCKIEKFNVLGRRMECNVFSSVA